MDRGFDHFFGFLGGFSDHFTGSPDYRLDREPFRDFGKNYYSSDHFTDRAINFIRKKDSNKPFFIYLSYQAPHNPLQADAEDIRKYRGKYLGGWQKIREARFTRQKASGIVPANAKLPAYPQNLPDWATLSTAQRDLEDLRMSVYAAMIDRMDRGINRLLESLEQTGHSGNTLILFLSDNGADPFSVVDQANLQKGKLPGTRGSNWQPGVGWAYASVTPWRLYKIGQHAGGITTGAIAWWPGGLHGPGRILPNPVHVVDIMPTLLDLIQKSEPDGAGESFLPALTHSDWRRNGPLFFQYMDNRAIRTAEWSLAEVDGSGWELFHHDDPLETLNLADQSPDVVAKLDNQWLEWWKTESKSPEYMPETTRNHRDYKPQGDRGSGQIYQPTPMPPALSGHPPP
jgi:arylsulfatase A-like enzyme